MIHPSARNPHAHKTTCAWLFLALFVLCSGHVYADEPAQPALPTIRVLAIGNSFSEDAVEQNLYELALESGVNLVIGNAYRGGQSLKAHWQAVTEGQSTLEYRKVVDGRRTTDLNRALSTIIADEPWDYITFQQVSHESGLYSTFEPYLSNLIAYARQHSTNPDTRYGYHMTWAYAQTSTNEGFANYDYDQSTMYQAILAATQQVLDQHPELTFLIPTGTAIQNVRTSYIGDNLNRDGYHLTRGLGRYTAACTWLEALLGVSAEGKAYHPSSVDSVEAATAQAGAHLAVQWPFELSNMKHYGYTAVRRIVPSSAAVSSSHLSTIHNLQGQQLRTLQRGLNIVGRRLLLSR